MPAHQLHTVQPNEETQTETTNDGLLHLARNLNIHPDVLIGDGNGILGTGMPGSGKTTLMALLLEQFGLCGLPFAGFDLEGDLASVVDFLPRGVLATATNCPTVQDMYEGGLQVIFDIASWSEDDGSAAIMISAMVNGLMNYARSRSSHMRVPFLVALDEAAYWLPQSMKGRTYFDEEQFKDLFNAFHGLAIRGRKMGLVPMLFTQRFADVHKDVLSPGTYILMKHTTDTDLKRYMEYISAAAFGEDDLTMPQIKKRISTFKRGQAIIKLPNGKQGLVQFHNRQSYHVSHAPKTLAAVNAYRDVQFDPNKRYGSFLTEDEMISAVSAAGKLSYREPDAESVVVTEKAKPLSAKEQVFVMLERDPDLDNAHLAAQIGCSLNTVRVARRAWLQWPEKKEPLVKHRILALLAENPNFTPSQVSMRLSCSFATAKRWMDRIQEEQ